MPLVTPSEKLGAASDGVTLLSFSHENCEKLKREHHPNLWILYWPFTRAKP